MTEPNNKYVEQSSSDDENPIKKSCSDGYHSACTIYCAEMLASHLEILKDEQHIHTGTAQQISDLVNEKHKFYDKWAETVNKLEEWVHGMNWKNADPLTNKNYIVTLKQLVTRRRFFRSQMVRCAKQVYELSNGRIRWLDIEVPFALMYIHCDICADKPY